MLTKTSLHNAEGKLTELGNNLYNNKNYGNIMIELDNNKIKIKIKI